MKTIKELAIFIQKELSYDANRVLHCPNCDYEQLSYWIDHKESLASNIAQFLGLKLTEPILDIINSIGTNGNNSDDAVKIAHIIASDIIKLK